MRAETWSSALTSSGGVECPRGSRARRWRLVINTTAAASGSPETIEHDREKHGANNGRPLGSGRGLRSLPGCEHLAPAFHTHCSRAHVFGTDLVVKRDCPVLRPLSAKAARGGRDARRSGAKNPTGSSRRAPPHPATASDRRRTAPRP